MAHITEDLLHDEAKKGRISEVEVPFSLTVQRLVPQPSAHAVSRQGVMVWGGGTLPPNLTGKDVIAKAIIDPPFSVCRPHVIRLQARQDPAQNRDLGYPDQFRTMVIQTSKDFIRFTVRRIDSDVQRGWGQDLHVDFLGIDDGVEP
jgi:hypothetical protein